MVYLTTLSIAHYAASDDRKIIELDRILKEAAVA
jgi:hypothetical protein